MSLCCSGWLCRQHQGDLQIGRLRGLRRTLLREELCPKQPRKKERTIPLVLFCLASSSLLSLVHVRLSFLSQLYTHLLPLFFFCFRSRSYLFLWQILELGNVFKGGLVIILIIDLSMIISLISTSTGIEWLRNIHSWFWRYICAYTRSYLPLIFVRVGTA